MIALTKKDRWFSTIGLAFLISSIVPIELWFLQILRGSSLFIQSISIRHSLAIAQLFSKLFSFMLIFVIIVYLLKYYKVFERLKYNDKWTAILFFNADWLWLYTVIIELSVKFSYLNLASLTHPTIFSYFGIFYGFNGFLTILAKMMLLVASTRLLVAIEPEKINYF